MTEEERTILLAEKFPATVGGETRPTTEIQPDMPMHTTFPPLIANDPARYDIFNTIIEQLLSNDNALNNTLDNCVPVTNGTAANLVYTEKTQSLGNISGDVSINMNSNGSISTSITGNTTFSFVPPQSGSASITLTITNGGNYLVDWTGVKFPYKTAPSLTTDGVDVVTIFYDGAQLFGISASDMG